MHVNRQYRLAISLARRSRFDYGESPFRQKGTTSATIRDYTQQGDQDSSPRVIQRRNSEVQSYPPHFAHRTSTEFVVPTSVGIVAQVSNRMLDEGSTSG
ncbi:MAG: hypothetical protein DWI00_06960 [Planctomycetota bacterium]|nr:MAG: hypothetical protein DWI00_06960 [Planctomycetota bacterium]